jgi:hypothetical protein
MAAMALLREPSEDDGHVIRGEANSRTTVPETVGEPLERGQKKIQESAKEDSIVSLREAL